MPRDEYAKNFLITDITGSFSFYTLIPIECKSEATVFSFLPFFSIFICGSILHYISLSGQGIAN